MATMSQQGCDVIKEVEESCFGPESWGRELVRPFRVTSAKYIEFLTDHFLPWYKKKNVPSAAKSSSCMTISCCKEYLCVIGCYGHKSRETHGVATTLP